MWSCDQTAPLNIQMLDQADARLEQIRGVVLIDGTPFTGTLYKQNPLTGDTLSLNTYWQGQKHGEWRSYFENGTPRDKRYYDRGKKTGAFVAWWPNGNPKLSYQFEAGEYDGLCREWNQRGLLVKQSNYQAGHENGEQKWWYDNGKIKANYIIKDGRRYGLLGTKNCINVSDSVFTN